MVYETKIDEKMRKTPLHFIFPSKSMKKNSGILFLKILFGSHFLCSQKKVENTFDFLNNFYINSHALFMKQREFLNISLTRRQNSCRTWYTIKIKSSSICRGSANVFKEFDHSSGWTLAVRLTHASRTGFFRSLLRENLVANGCVTR